MRVGIFLKSYPIYSNKFYPKLRATSHYSRSAITLYAALFFDVDFSIGAPVNINPKGFNKRFKVSFVGLCRGLIARRIFGLAILALFENSFTPIARMTFPRTT